MKRIFFVLAIVLCIAIECIAKPFSYSYARQIATTFLQNRGAAVKDDDAASNAPNSIGRQSTTEASPYYVFNATSDQGFVIVSGDDCVGDNLVLGYSDSGSFDAGSVPANMQWWLDMTASHITELSRLGVKAMSVPVHDDIPYLIKTVWDQGDNVYNPTNPFNASCPKINGMLCATGCMATALAQVMYYHRCPQGPIVGELPAYDAYGGQIVDALPSTSFDWDNMVEDYRESTTKEQQDAVAQLMRYCGQVSQMIYGLDVSSSFFYDIDMLVTQFGYDSGLHLARSEGYSLSGWDKLLYDELAEGRPLLYSGESDNDGGHAFIIDGYAVQDGSGYYHVNWGWSGKDDGYFRINMLYPSDGVSYNNRQEAYIGMQPAVGPVSNYSRYLTQDWWDGIRDETSHTFYAFNISPTPGIFEIALAELNEDGSADCSRLFGLQQVNAKGFTNELYARQENLVAYTLPEGIAEGMTPGSHKLVPVNREAETGTDWHTLFGTACTIEFIIDDDGQLKETIYHPVQQLVAAADEFKIEGLCQRGFSMTWPVTLINKSDDGYVGLICCDVYDVKDNIVYDWFGSHYTGFMSDGNETSDAIFSFSIANPGTYLLLVNINGPLVIGTSLDDIKDSEGYIMHQTVTIDPLDFFCRKLSYSERSDETNVPSYYLDAVMENKTPLDYKASLQPRIYKRNDEGDYDPVFPEGPTIYSPMSIQSNTSDGVSVKLPGQLEAGEYLIDLKISNTFKPATPDGYFVLDTIYLTIPDPTGIKDVVKSHRAVGQGDGATYNLSGQRVSDDYKGIVISNGNKYIR